MIDLTNIGGNLDGNFPVQSPRTPQRPVQKPKPVEEPMDVDNQIAKMASEFAQVEDPSFKKYKQVEQRRKAELGNNLYDPTDFGALQTDRGFISDKDKAQEIYSQRKQAGEIPDVEEEFVE